MNDGKFKFKVGQKVVCSDGEIPTVIGTVIGLLGSSPKEVDWVGVKVSEDFLYVYHAWHDAFILDQIFILLLFVIFGTLIPIILNKWNSLIPNLKIYIFFNVIVALLSKIRFFNFDLTILRILACILGFYIFKYLIKKLGD